MDGQPVIVLDTTEMFNAGRLSNVVWRRILAYTEENLVRMVVPEVVLQETLRHFDRAIRKASKDGIDHFKIAQDAFRRLDVHVEGSVKDLREQIRAEAQSYGPWLRRELLESGVTIAAHPTIAHDRLVEWAMSERQPFKQTGEGYRDSLIWATVLDLAERGSADGQIWFVSDNVADFHASPGHLATALLEDLEEIEDCPSVVLFRSLEQLLADRGDELAKLYTRANVLELIRSLPSVSDLIERGVSAACDNLHGESVPESTWFSTRFGGQVEEPNFYWITPHLQSIDWQVAEEFEGGTLVGSARVQADLEVDGYMTKGEAFADAEQGRVEILDGDFNDHSAWVAVEVAAELEFALTVQTNAEDVDDVEFIGIDWIE